MHHIVLIPGFLGFGNLGALQYFIGVKEAIEPALAARGVQAQVHEVQTLPTGSIRQRGARVLETLAHIGDDPDDPIHLIGHSTGGLDARFAIAPTASLPVDPDIDALEIYHRVSTIISVSTPHFGTPLADVFGSTMGRPALAALSGLLVLLLQHGKLPLSAAFKLAGLWSRADDIVGQRDTILDEIYEQFLADFTDERRHQLIEYVEAVAADQSLVFQLTAAGCDILNGATGDPDHARYGCVVTRAPAPRIRQVVGWRHGGDAYARALYCLYAALYAVAARSRETLLPALRPHQEHSLRTHFGDVPAPSDNDGIVPTRSQVWGEVIDAVDADHLDLIGHFGRHRDALASDWLPSGSRFRSQEFHRTWTRVADFIADQVHRPRRAPANERGQPPISLAAAAR